jgi:hypothetical protein
MGVYSNQITPAQITLAEAALNVWETAAEGAVRFTRNTTAPAEQIINIGLGDLAALGAYQSGPGGILALGGGTFTADGLYTITAGIAWMDMAENWDGILGNGNPPGTYDFFTVVAHEIGHAIGLGHTDDVPGMDLMDGFYGGEKTAASAFDAALIRAVYANGGSSGGANGTPIPGTHTIMLTSGEVLTTAELRQPPRQPPARGRRRRSVSAATRRGLDTGRQRFQRPRPRVRRQHRQVRVGSGGRRQLRVHRCGSHRALVRTLAPAARRHADSHPVASYGQFRIDAYRRR